MALIRPPSRSPLWVWAKVAVCLLVLDLLLFRWGLLWRLSPTLPQADPTTWGLLYDAARQLEAPSPALPPAVVVGSSVLFLGIDGAQLETSLRAQGAATDVQLLTTFGSSATDSALLAWRALGQKPWLVVYAAASRDFQRSAALDTPVSRLYDDASEDVPVLAPASVGAWVERWVKRGWGLYRYRYFLRRTLLAAADAYVPAVGRALGSPPPTFRPPPGTLPAAEPAGDTSSLPPEATLRFHSNRITASSYALWEHWRESRRFEDYAAWMRASQNAALTQYATETLGTYGPEGNPQAASLDWMLRRLDEAHTRVVVAFFPENPAFRERGGEPYFDPALSDANAALFARAATAHRAHFVDLRNALDAEDFYDLIHPNVAGMHKLTGRMADVVAEEWRAAHAAGRGP